MAKFNRKGRRAWLWVNPLRERRQRRESGSVLHVAATGSETSSSRHHPNNFLRPSVNHLEASELAHSELANLVFIFAKKRQSSQKSHQKTIESFCTECEAVVFGVICVAFFPFDSSIGRQFLAQKLYNRTVATLTEPKTYKGLRPV